MESESELWSCELDRSQRKWFNFSLCAAPLQSLFVSISKAGVKLRGDERELSQASRETEGIQVDIWTAELQGKLQFKYKKLVAEFRIVGVVEYVKAVAKNTDIQD